MTIGPAAAESWDVSPDGKTYSFKLRDGMVYHNGDKVKAADVKWLWDRRMAARSPVRHGSAPQASTGRAA